MAKKIPTFLNRIQNHRDYCSLWKSRGRQEIFSAGLLAFSQIASIFFGNYQKPFSWHPYSHNCIHYMKDDKRLSPVDFYFRHNCKHRIQFFHHLQKLLNLLVAVPSIRSLIFWNADVVSHKHFSDCRSCFHIFSFSRFTKIKHTQSFIFKCAFCVVPVIVELPLSFLSEFPFLRQKTL